LKQNAILSEILENNGIEFNWILFLLK
jgi:hypothetical protein